MPGFTADYTIAAKAARFTIHSPEPSEFEWVGWAHLPEPTQSDDEAERLRKEEKKGEEEGEEGSSKESCRRFIVRILF